METSAKEDSNVKKVFEMLTTKVLEKQSGEKSSESAPNGTALKKKDAGKKKEKKDCC